MSSWQNQGEEFPQTEEETQAEIEGFASISWETAINNRAGAVDGHVLRIKLPSKKEASNVRSFFSAHYQCHGINAQAVCDHHSGFIFFGVSSVGVTADRDAMQHCRLEKFIAKLPFAICFMGDAACEPTEHTVPVHFGADRAQAKHHNLTTTQVN